MKLLDYLFLNYYIVFRRAPRNHFFASIFFTAVFPLFFVFLGIYFYLSSFFITSPKPIRDTIMAAIAGAIIYSLLIKILTKRYSNRLSEFNDKCDKLDKYRVLFIILTICLYFISLVIFFLSFIFIPVTPL